MLHGGTIKSSILRYRKTRENSRKCGSHSNPDRQIIGRSKFRQLKLLTHVYTKSLNNNFLIPFMR